ncbi:TadE/TadG family type IV pilus assembly protein [Microbacterium sp. LjRoot45]|uniref:TadE/TadG family type IV pilus assembly protein n=1 Tax=Microbacterium sp. LjRoot45 TaxID=3342329 RepID=UPI003ED0BB7B
MRGLLREDRGSSAVEFLLVGLLLTALTLGVLQFALTVYLRNVVHDAAVEGAFHAALADVDVREGATRAVAVVERAIGDGYGVAASAALVGAEGREEVEVSVTATLPLVGIFGVPAGWEVTARAPRESLAG